MLQSLSVLKVALKWATGATYGGKQILKQKDRWDFQTGRRSSRDGESHQQRVVPGSAGGFDLNEIGGIPALNYLASVNRTASLLIVPFEIAMSLPSKEKR